MSIDYRIEKKVSAHDLFCGRLATFGVREYVADTSELVSDDGTGLVLSNTMKLALFGTSERSRCLTDGDNFLWVYLTEDGIVSFLTRNGADNDVDKILAAISEAFETDIFSEDEPQYWGFDTQEELKAECKKISDQRRDQKYADVCAYIRGEPNDIKPGTIGENEAKIAKALVENHAALLQPENKDRLLAEIDAVYDRDHAVDALRLEEVFGPGPEAVVTLENDRPKA